MAETAKAKDYWIIGWQFVKRSEQSAVDSWQQLQKIGGVAYGFCLIDLFSLIGIGFIGRQVGSWLKDSWQNASGQ